MSALLLLSYLRVAVVFLVIIAVLVAAHEYGHYLFARIFKMGVEEFAIGMGKKLKIWRTMVTERPVPNDYSLAIEHDESGSALEGSGQGVPNELIERDGKMLVRETTEFTVRAVPLGGFVRIKGMQPREDGSEAKVAGGFHSRPPWQRLIVLIAGPAFSVIAGILVLVGYFAAAGVEKPSLEPILGSVSADGPAGNALLQEGDRVVRISWKNGKAVESTPINTSYDLVSVVSAKGGIPISVAYIRDGKEFSADMTPDLRDGRVLSKDMELTNETTKHGFIGISIKPVHQEISFGEAVGEALKVPGQAVDGLVGIFKKPSRFKEEAGGAITMVAATNAAIDKGIGQVVWLAAVLSISIGIFNLLPIPPLDGGQMLIAILEMLRGGRRLSLRVQTTLFGVGMATVLVLFLAVFYVDIQRFTSGAEKNSKPPKTQKAPDSK